MTTVTSPTKRYPRRGTVSINCLPSPFGAIACRRVYFVVARHLQRTCRARSNQRSLSWKALGRCSKRAVVKLGRLRGKRNDVISAPQRSCPGVEAKASKFIQLIAGATHRFFELSLRTFERTLRTSHRNFPKLVPSELTKSATKNVPPHSTTIRDGRKGNREILHYPEGFAVETILIWRFTNHEENFIDSALISDPGSVWQDRRRNSRTRDLSPTLTRPRTVYTT